MICQGKYAEHQIAFMQVTEDLSSGFAMTVDSFCTGGSIRSNLIPYKKIKNVSYGYSGSLGYHLGISLVDNEVCFPADYNDENACKNLFGESTIFRESNYTRIEKFLKIAKNF